MGSVTEPGTYSIPGWDNVSSKFIMKFFFSESKAGKGQTDEQTDGWTDEQTVGQTYRQTDRRTDR